MTNKTIEQIQEENRKLIIRANNPEAKSYEEALEMELGFGCGVVLNKEFKYYNTWKSCFEKKGSIVIKGISDCAITLGYRDEYHNEFISLGDNFFKEKGFCKIIGKPLTLDRVLIALKNNGDLHYYTLEYIFYISLVNQNADDQIEWNLTKPILEEQDEETQREINKLLNNAK